MCDSSAEKGVFLKNPVLIRCSYCVCKELKSPVLGISMDSESRSHTSQDIFKEQNFQGKQILN